MPPTLTASSGFVPKRSKSRYFEGVGPFKSTPEGCYRRYFPPLVRESDTASCGKGAELDILKLRLLKLKIEASKLKLEV
jgi:hypothetical protein